MNKKSVLSLAVLLSTGLVFAAEDGWVNLFNGKDLTGWVQRGGKAKYSVKDGAIVGSAVLNTQNSFLCTEKAYGDFILELEFKVDPQLNSGVQIRSECFDKAITIKADGKQIPVPGEPTIKMDGKEIPIPGGRVHGYQVEIDMDQTKDRWWSGCIYDEARRGWLYPGPLGGDKDALTKQGAKLSKRGDWNQFRVEAVGDTIKTFLNGEPRAEIKDHMTLRGFIGLQVHTVGKDKGKEGLTVQFRNIRLKPVSG